MEDMGEEIACTWHDSLPTKEGYYVFRGCIYTGSSNIFLLVGCVERGRWSNAENPSVLHFLGRPIDVYTGSWQKINNPLAGEYFVYNPFENKVTKFVPRRKDE